MTFEGSANIAGWDLSKVSDPVDWDMINFSPTPKEPPSSNHPYLYRTLLPGPPVTLSFYDDGPVEFRNDLLRDLLFFPGNGPVVLKPFLETQEAVGNTSEDFFKEAYGDDSIAFLRNDYPSMYLIIDDLSNGPAYDIGRSYLEKQKTISFGIFGVESTKGLCAVCAVLAGPHLAVMFDLRKLTLPKVSAYFKSILVDESVVKVVNGFRDQMRFIRYHCRCVPVNVYDVSAMELYLQDRRFSMVFTMENLFRRYWKECAFFRTSRVEHFSTHTLTQLPRYGLRRIAKDERENVLKQVIFLGVIRRLQEQRVMRRMVDLVSEDITVVYDYEDPRSTLGKNDPWADDVNIELHDTEIQKILPQIALDNLATADPESDSEDSSELESGIEGDEEDYSYY